MNAPSVDSGTAQVPPGNETTSSTGPWAIGSNPYAVGALAIGIADLVLGIILRASDGSGTWVGILSSIRQDLGILVAVFFLWTIIVLAFAVIRRPDAAYARFRGFGVVGQWVAILAVVCVIVAAALDNTHASLAEQAVGSVIGSGGY